MAQPCCRCLVVELPPNLNPCPPQHPATYARATHPTHHRAVLANKGTCQQGHVRSQRSSHQVARRKCHCMERGKSAPGNGTQVPKQQPNPRLWALGTPAPRPRAPGSYAQYLKNVVGLYCYCVSFTQAPVTTRHHQHYWLLVQITHGRNCNMKASSVFW